MKKLLATIFTVVLLLTIVPTAYAEENNIYKVGDIIQFGSYPQSEVKDEALLTELNKIVPEWEEWTSYGYYSGNRSAGSMVQGDWMRYFDVEYEGEKYRSVKFTQYRPHYTCGTSSDTYQIDNDYYINTVYWFKFEPVDWRILDPNIGFVISEKVIDSQAYSDTFYYDGKYDHFNDPAYTNYASDYETSSIRKWLNYDFYNTAFTESEKTEILTTTLNNDGYYTSVGMAGCEEFDSDETNDKIFLLSYKEAKNNSIGFSSDAARFGKGSAYAMCQGLRVYSGTDNTYFGNSMWHLRTSISDSSNCAVFQNGFVDMFGSDSWNNSGIRPALCFNDISVIAKPEHKHSYISEITVQPTHTRDGVRTFTCKCGDTYKELIPKLLDHTFTVSIIIAPDCETEGYTAYTCECGDCYNDDLKPATGHKYNTDNICSVCGKNKSENCSCNCHKVGIGGFIWKIINFINKLFRINPVCTCGVAHY